MFCLHTVVESMLAILTPKRRRKRIAATVTLLAATAAMLAACGGDHPSEPNARVGVPPPTTDGGAVSFNLVSDWSAGDSTTAPLLTVRGADQAEDQLRVVKDGQNLRIVFLDATGAEHTIATSIASWMPGEAHIITSTWGNGQATLYIDGHAVGQTAIPGAPAIHSGAPVYIGSDLPSPFPRPSADGVISNFQVYSKPLPPEQIFQLAMAPTPGGATLRVSSPTVNSDGDAATVCVGLENGYDFVAGTQNDLVWDHDCITLVSACEANPQLGKQVLAHDFGSNLRTLVLSLTDTDPIPDGELYCCGFQANLSEPGACCPVQIEGVVVSSPMGQMIPATGVSGVVCRGDDAAGS